MVEQQPSEHAGRDEVLEDGGVALRGRHVVLRVRELPLGSVRGTDDDVGDVVRQVELLEVVQAGPVVEVAEHDDRRGGVSRQPRVEIAPDPHALGGDPAAIGERLDDERLPRRRVLPQLAAHVDEVRLGVGDDQLQRLVADHEVDDQRRARE